MLAIRKLIIGRLGLALAVVVAALSMASTASASGLPQQWDPRTVAVNHEVGNTFLLRPGEILAGPGDAADVQRVLTGWRQRDRRPFGVTVFTRTPQKGADPAREVLDAIARVRKATSMRPQGSARVAPNHVFVGEAAGGCGDQLLWRAARHGRAGLVREPGDTARGPAATREPAW